MTLQVPKLPDLAQNKTKRANLKLLWLTNPATKQWIKDRCKGDPNDIESVVQGFYFWAEHTCWTHNEHKPPAEREGNLVLWEYQRDLSRELITEAFNCANDFNYRWNGYGEKVRMIAFTFTVLLVLQYLWQFHGISSVVTSKTDEDVDIQNDMNTPFEKLRFQIERQPDFLLPEGFNVKDKEHYKKKLIAIRNGGAQIAGIAPNGKKMRQARALIWFADEFPHTENDYEVWEASSGTVKMRIAGGTPNTPTCKAYRVRFNKDGENARIFEMPWYVHPEYAQGLYKKEDGTYSSPWFDSKCASESRRTIAREYLMDWNDAQEGRIFFMFRSTESGLIGLEPILEEPLFRIWDPGRCMAVLWGQVDHWKTIRFYHELALTEEEEFTDSLLNVIARKAIAITDQYFPNFHVVDIGDPYASRKQIASQKKTEYQLLYDRFKIRVQSAFLYKISSSERLKARIELLGDKMSEDIEETGYPGLLIDPRGAPLLYEGFMGAYRRPVGRDGKVITGEVLKNHPINDVVDCAGMLALKAFYSKRNTNNTDHDPPQEKRERRQTVLRRTGRARYA